jgi:transposase-like protein
MSERGISACTARQTRSTALFRKIDDHNGVPETVTIDQSGANLAALKAINAERESPIRIGQRKYLNNIVEQDHRASNAGYARCWDSRNSATLPSYSVVSNSCT